MATVAKQQAGRKAAAARSSVSRLEQIKSWPARFSAYVESLKREMRLVTWPSRQQVRATTIVVLVTVFAFALFFGIVDYVLALGQTKLYQYFTR